MPAVMSSALPQGIVDGIQEFVDLGGNVMASPIRSETADASGSDARTGIICRPQLFERLTGAGRVTRMSAPTGSGGRPVRMRGSVGLNFQLPASVMPGAGREVGAAASSRRI